MQKLTAGEPDTQSADLISGNIEGLRTLFPDAFTEGEVDFEVLRELLGDTIDDHEERYGLNWRGKRAARRLALTPSTGTLRPAPEESMDWETTQNLMIEGDNLEILKLLQQSYAGKVQLIYIDPPYNTGNDFIYPDDFRDGVRNYLRISGQLGDDGRPGTSNPETSGRYHTDWLTMMYPRLVLARQMLSPGGVISVSIDEHEAHNLRALLDEVFGGENYISAIAVSLNPKGRQLAPFFATAHEYIVMYARNIDACILHAESSENVDSADFPLVDSDGSYRLLPLRNTNKKFNPSTRPNLYYPLYATSGGQVSITNSPGAHEIWPVFGDRSPAVWRWSGSKVSKQHNDLYGRLVNGRAGERWDVFQVDRLTEGRTKKLQTVWLAADVGSTDSAVQELKVLMGEAVFETPKPISLMRRLLQLMPPDSLVLDFFAGSGTMGGAVLAQNAADGGHRRYIMAQLPEFIGSDNDSAAKYCDRIGKPRNIAELTKERLRRAARKIRAKYPMFSGDTGFRVFKLDSSNIREWEPDREDIAGTLDAAIVNLKADRTEDDILYELLLKRGIELTVPAEQRQIAGKMVHSIGAGTLLVCLATRIERAAAEPLALGIVAWHEELAPAGDARVIFRDSAFADDVAKTNLAEILKQHGLADVKSI